MYNTHTASSYENNLLQNTVRLPNDRPNMQLRVNVNSPLWRTIRAKDGWKLQKNLIIDITRIISPSGICMGNGEVYTMDEKMKRLQSGNFIKCGDIIGVTRRKGLYEHYGIYIGNKRIIHYCGESDDFSEDIRIKESDFCEFAQDINKCFIVNFYNERPMKLSIATDLNAGGFINNYTDRFIRKRKKIFSAEATVTRAISRIGEKKYNLVANNCEHFAFWCKTGISESSQVNSILNCITRITLTSDIII